MWWYTMSMIIHTFFERADLTGVMVATFNTHMNSHDGEIYAAIREPNMNSDGIDGLPVEMRAAETGSGEVVAKLLSDINLHEAV